MVGRFDLGDGEGRGRFPTARDPRGLIEISLTGDWHETLDALLHEALELVLNSMGKSWGSALVDHHESPADRIFCFSHQDFTEACCRTSDYLMPILSGLRPLERQWCRAHREKFMAS